MVDAVECLTEIDRDMTSVDLLTHPFDSVEHGVLGTVVRPVSVMHIGKNVIVMCLKVANRSWLETAA